MHIYIYIYIYNIKLKEKIPFFDIIINLFQIYDDPLQMTKEKILLHIWISFSYVYIASGDKRTIIDLKWNYNDTIELPFFF